MEVIVNITDKLSKGTITHYKKILKFYNVLEDDETLTEISKMVGEAVTPFIPYENGALRNSMEAQPGKVLWGRYLDYAHYQFVGTVYAPNYPIMKDGQIVRWYSPIGHKKYPTERKLKYKTPGTRSRWTDAYAGRVKNSTNNKITAYLKKKCKELGLNK